ncbi:MAG: 1-deoxy-D-xylulose-5-phosphate synthase [Flavobacteriales bacterium]|nr:1-deoxy-D-xylulose-5-phosphate synthase [Flavobacteriales bacterium]MBE37597.1 1-deoxy-D-xylulose-5-phosphate synthase [Flavobacteriales bacterium]|tara:strand:+ start:3074 stop:4969 length:1896 start_codon:yes stop_codon:yes gene_type:complete
MKHPKNNLLSKINSPNDLKLLKKSDLETVCIELRNFIIDSVSKNGGHFGASLGVVELTVALHYVFDAPNDLIVWDVGHQAYGHKILTGRRDLFHTNRKHKGISGFPKIKESLYDSFGVGHSSTSIGACLGMSVASTITNKLNRQHIAIIGDGALTGGQAFEALNHAGIENSNLMVILNDNCMSIDPNVGALKDYLLKISTSKTYNKIRDEIWDLLGNLSKIGDSAKSIVQKVEHGLKSVLLKHSNYFESLNFRYFGPIDGHNVELLEKTLRDLKDIPGPKILHCLTTKGKGYDLAEKNQTKWHAPGIFDKNSGKITINNPHSKYTKYQDVFGRTIIELAKKNEKIIGITPAMPSGSSLKYMMEEIPERAFDVGIAEQHAVTFSAGLATQGLIPFCNIYSTFLQRGYDQLIHDVALQKLHVVFCLDRAGLVGEDGATHQGVFDLAYLRCIPNIIISAPLNEIELRNLMYTAQLKQKYPFAIRYPRGRGVLINWKKPMKKIEIGSGKMIADGKKICFISIGHIGNVIIDINNSLQKTNSPVGHCDIRFLKPLDEKLLHSIFKQYEIIMTLEDGCIKGGLGSAIIEFASDNDYVKKIIRFGVPDSFIEHGTQEEQRKECGYDKNSILKRVKELL